MRSLYHAGQRGHGWSPLRIFPLVQRVLRGEVLIGVVLALSLVLARSASAQVFTGRIDVTVQNAAGEPLPGTVVDLAGPTLQTQVSDPQGRVHFLNLPVGTYTVKATLPAFNPYVNNRVEVDAGAATPLPITLAAAGTERTLDIVAATSAVDMTRETTTTNVALEELQDFPRSRDPWAVMPTVPAVYVDRVNVGGSDSDQQATFIGKGAVSTDNTWNIDGVPVTDMGAAGSSPTFYDFDTFRAMAFTTGGADARNPTPGVQVNLVFKNGANIPHWNARLYFANERLQSTNIPSDLIPTLGGTGGKGNRIDRLRDYGFEIGGPILKDYWWGWVSRGRTALRTLTLTSQLDESTLKDFAMKFDGRPPHRNLRGNFTLFDGNRIKNGSGVSATRPAETGWNETAPTRYYKAEADYVFHRNFVAAARMAQISAASDLVPAGGLDRNIFQDDALVWHGSYFLRKTDRPQRYAGGDASLFAGRHELKFGFGWRRTPAESQSVVPGSKVVTHWVGYPNLLAFARQDYAFSGIGRYTNAFVTDTIQLARTTLIAGLRYDLQTSSLSATEIPAVLNVPLLPAVSVEPVSDVYRFRNITPRLGVTYTVDEARKTLVRASYAEFASQLPANAASFVSPIQPDTYVYYNAVDRNGNGVADLNEIDFAAGVRGSSNIDRLHPGVLTAVNRVGDVTAPRTREILLGVDREFTPDVAVHATFTYRYADNLIWNPPIGARPADYHETTVLTGDFPGVGSVAVPVFGITTSQIGREALNREGYYRRYLAFEAGATKRMSDRWMARIGFASSQWNEYFDDRSLAILDPTPTPSASDQYANFTASGPLVNGGPVVVAAGGSGRSAIYMLPPRYQAAVSAMYEGPFGVNFAGNLAVREGYGEPFFVSRVASGDSLVPAKNVLLVDRPDRFRLDGVKLLDLRLEKRFKFQNANLALDFDVFNVLNTATILGRQYDARSTAFQQVLEIMNPRIARLGARFFF
jgi:hypothetical protein